MKHTFEQFNSLFQTYPAAFAKWVEETHGPLLTGAMETREWHRLASFFVLEQAYRILNETSEAKHEPRQPGIDVASTAPVKLSETPSTTPEALVGLDKSRPIEGVDVNVPGPCKGIKADVADIGRSVIYREGPAWLAEHGTLTGISPDNRTVFVRYDGELNSKATSACDLDWADGK